MEEIKVWLAVRVVDELHRKAKLQAYKEGKTLQDWIADLIETKLKNLKSKRIRLCEACGHWELKGTQMAILGKCEQCKKESAVFPCEEE